MTSFKSRAVWTFVLSTACMLAFASMSCVGITLADDATKAIEPLMRTIDLTIGESQQVTLCNGKTVNVRLVGVTETRDPLRNAVRVANVVVEVNGERGELVSAMYNLPKRIGGVQIDSPVTKGYTANSSKQNAWSLEKHARIRLWPDNSPWIRPGTLTYPVRQRWFASDTQMANDPCYVDGGEIPGQTDIYYHYGLDFGGSEGQVAVVAATAGIVVSAADKSLSGHADSPVKPRYDVIYIVDGRGWYYRYSHLMRIDVQPGQKVTMGEQIGLLGKEGGSGGWSHLHFDITSRQPSGEWGKQDAYCYAWETWIRENSPPLIAVARPHQLVTVGQHVRFDGTKSWCASGEIVKYDWGFAQGAVVERTYARPGTYSEVLKVTARNGDQTYESWDFAVVQVMDPDAPADEQPPSIHAVYYPTRNIRPGDPVTFKVRSFRTTNDGEETWDFGDGNPKVNVKSDGNSNVHDPNGYAVCTHKYQRPGSYLVTVERSNDRGEFATGHLSVEVEEPFEPRTTVAIKDDRWRINDRVTYPGAPAEGLLMNVRMVNATFEDLNRDGFDSTANLENFIEDIPEYVAAGVRAFTFNMQGGMPGYEGALNSAYTPDGALRPSYTDRIRRVVQACDRHGAVVILGCFYQRQDQVLKDADAVRLAIANVVDWIDREGFTNVVLEIANEYGHGGFDHHIIQSTDGEMELLDIVRKKNPKLLVSTSGVGDGRYNQRLIEAVDFLLVHFNGTKTDGIPSRIAALKKFGKPIVCNEDAKVGEEGALAAELSVRNGASWGFMSNKVNQYEPFEFDGIQDDPAVYAMLKKLTRTDK